MRKDKIREESTYILITIISTIMLAYFLLGVYKMDINVPYIYSGGDGMTLAVMVKGMGENGWFFINPNLGAPFEGTLYDYPFSGDAFWFVILKILSMIFKDYGIVLNIFYLIIFPLTAVITYLVFRTLKIKQWISVIGSLTFSFLFYRFARGDHLMLAAYCFIPLAVLFCIWAYRDDEYFKFHKNFFKNYKNIVTLITLPIIASTGMYYAFFMCFFLLIVIFSKVCKRPKDFKGLIPIISMIVIIGISIIILAIPSQIYINNAGVNLEAPSRAAIDVENYGLKITRLYMPVANRNIPILKQIQGRYANAPLQGEPTEYLGLIGIIGFTILIVILFLEKKKKNSEIELLGLLARFNIGSILLATIGGFSSIFALIISPQIRAYNRISVYIAFFSILCVGILLNTIDEKIKNKKYMLRVVVTTIALFGIVEQSSGYKPNYEYANNRYYSDQRFVRHIEESLDDESMVFQLPYQRFPENPMIYNMRDYESFRGYLHSDNLKWSYGAYRGRRADQWNQKLTTYQTDKMIESLAFAGFTGVYIDRNGYSIEELAGLEEKLSGILESNKYLSEDESLSFFDMNNYVDKLKQNMTTEEWNKQSKIARGLNAYLGNGFYPLETDGERTWNWCNKSGEIIIDNILEESMEITLEMQVFNSSSQENNIWIENEDSIQYSVNNEGTHITYNIVVKPGINVIKLETDGERVIAPEDDREMYFYTDDWRIK